MISEYMNGVGASSSAEKGETSEQIEAEDEIAKMQWSLCVLILMGQCSLSLCQLYMYHFINENKTWREARAYCREKYTDLATVSNMSDLRRLEDLTGGRDAWIGLKNEPEAKETWYWSMPGMEFSDDITWQYKEPNSLEENCVALRENEAGDFKCKAKKPFVCYDETDKQIHIGNGTLSWFDAQRYCRKHHTDLASGLEQLEEFRSKNESLESKDYWIGLFTDKWRWSDGSQFSFRSWDQDPFTNTDVQNNKCAFTLNEYMSFADCSEKRPFICYKDSVILINEEKTWEDALYYCRDHFEDLVSIDSLDEQRWVQEKAKKAQTSHVWLGLRYTCTLDFWFWVSDKVLVYENWNKTADLDDCDMSAAMETGGQHQWFKVPDDQRFNFICSV